MFGFIGRLEEQKGVDILIEALPAVARQGGAQVVVLGTGKKALEAAVLQLDKQFPDTVKGVVKFDVPLAHLMTAGERLCHAATSHLCWQPGPCKQPPLCQRYPGNLGGAVTRPGPLLCS